MPIVAKCPVCDSAFSATPWEIKTRHRVTCSAKCAREWKSLIADKKPVGQCQGRGCTYHGPLEIKKFCPKHFQYFWRHGYPDIPEHDAKPIEMEEKWALWLAGVIDCEGWIGLFQSSRKNGVAHWAGVAVGNTNQLLIDRISSLTGVGSVSFVKRPKPAKHIHRWAVNKVSDVRAVLLAIRPHLILKAAQADLILSLPPPNTRATKLRAEIKKKMTILNRKGRR